MRKSVQRFSARPAPYLAARPFGTARGRLSGRAELVGLTRLRDRGEPNRLALGIEHVVAQARHRVDALCDLQLEHHEFAIAEAHLVDSEVILPHPAEARVVETV